MKTWKFKLQYGTKILDFGSELVSNWNDIKVSIVSNETLRGAQFVLSNVFEFIGDARSFIRDSVDSGGIDAEVYLTISIGNESAHNSSFKRFFKPLKASFGKTYEIDEAKSKIAFAISGFEEMLMNRIDSDIQYSISESIDGDLLDEPIYHKINMPDRVLVGFADYNLTYKFERTGVTFLANCKIISSTFQTTQEVFFNELTSSTNLNDLILFPFIDKLKEDTKIHFTSNKISISAKRNDGFIYCGIYFRLVLIRDGNNTLLYNDSSSGSANGSDIFTHHVILDQTFDFLEGDAVALYYIIEMTTSPTQEIAEINVSGNMILDYKSNFPATSSNCILPHDAFSRTIAQITGNKIGFKSNFFGLASLGYTQNGAGAYTAIMNGLMIRSFPISECKIGFNLKDLLNTFINIYNLVAWIENDTLRIEKFEDYYDFNNYIEIETISPIKVNLIEKMHYSNIKYGYAEVQLEEVTGLDSPHGQIELQTPLKSVKNSLDLTVKDITNDYVIEFARRKDYVRHPKEDYRFDKDHFLIEGAEDSNGFVRVVQGSEYPNVEGILSPNTAYNIGLRPSVILKNWERVINSGLYLLNEKIIKFTRGANNTDLSVDGVKDAKNVAIKDLAKPILLPYMLTFQGVVTQDMFEKIAKTPNIMVKCGGFYGIIDEMEYNINNDEAEFKLIRANR